jgi:hypothetical protein
MFTMVLIDGILSGFSKFPLFIPKNCILMWDFGVPLGKIIACAGWAYTEKISSLAEHMRKRFHRTLSLRRTNFRACSASVQILTVFTWPSKRMLSQRGNNFIASWASKRRTISSLAKHMRKRFHRLLTIRGKDLIYGRAYVETISSLAEPLKNRVNSMMANPNPSRLWMGRLVYRREDSSTEEKIRAHSFYEHLWANYNILIISK